MELEIVSVDKEKKRAIVKMQWRTFSIQFDISIFKIDHIQQDSLELPAKIQTVWEAGRLSKTIKWLCEDAQELPGSDWPLEFHLRNKINDRLRNYQG